MRQILMGRANRFRAPVASLAADEFLLLREAVDERRCREEVGVDTLAEAAEVPTGPSLCARGAAYVRKAMGGRLVPGSLLIHDLERAHGAVFREGGLDSEAHRANVNDPVYTERMEMVNDLRSWLKRYLRRFAGMSTRNLKAYLDWYVYLFRVNQACDRWSQLQGW